MNLTVFPQITDSFWLEPANFAFDESTLVTELVLLSTMDEQTRPKIEDHSVEE
jgi:hypothetical protein